MLGIGGAAPGPPRQSAKATVENIDANSTKEISAKFFIMSQQGLKGFYYEFLNTHL
jgi:hypothetical protein